MILSCSDYLSMAPYINGLECSPAPVLSGLITGTFALALLRMTIQNRCLMATEKLICLCQSHRTVIVQRSMCSVPVVKQNKAFDGAGRLIHSHIQLMAPANIRREYNALCSQGSGHSTTGAPGVADSFLHRHALR